MTSRRRDVLLAAAIVLLAFSVRWVYLHQAERVPLFAVPISDSQAYLEWAQRIAAGDVASRSTGVFYQAPLYPYFLASQRAVGLDSLGAHRLVQAVAAALACGLLFLAGRLQFGARVGTFAGLLLAFFAPGIFYEGSIQKESLAGLAVAGLLCALFWAQRRGAGWWLLPGTVLGGLVLVRENALLLAPLLAVWVHLQGEAPAPRRRWRDLSLFVAGLALALAPVALRNRVVGGEWVLTTAQAGPNFYIGNHAGATGSYVPLRAGRSDTPLEREDAVSLAERALGRSLSAREVSRFWLGKGLSFVRSEPLAWLKLLAIKTAMVVSAFEVPDAEDYTFYRDRVPVLRVLGSFLHFGLLLPLAVAGCALAWDQRRSLVPVILVAGGLAAGPILFFVFGRYRFPMVAPLCLLAALGLSLALQQSRRRWLAVVLFLVLGLAVNRPVPDSWRGNAGMAELNLGVALARLGRLEDAVVEYRRALARTPDLVEGHANLGSTLLFLGRTSEAIPHLRRAVELQPDDAELRRQLEAALARSPVLRAPR